MIVELGGNKAIVFNGSRYVENSPWGRRISGLTPHEVASVARTMDAATKALIESRRMTGQLVELDGTSRAMLSTAKAVVEDGGWIQATLRDSQNQFARVMRIRPATALSAAVGVTGVLGSVAAQAQAAEMARDIKAIRQRTDEIYKHLQSDQIGSVENAVDQVESLITRLRAHGADGVDPGEVAVTKQDLGAQTRRCLRHLHDALARLEGARGCSLHQAEKVLSQETAEEVDLYISLLGELRATSVRLGLAQVALDCTAEKLDLVRTRIEQVTETADGLKSEIEAALERIGGLDGDLRRQFKPLQERFDLRPATATASLARAVGRAVPRAGAELVGPVAAVGVIGVNAVVQHRAENKLNDRLRLLSDTCATSAQDLIKTDACLTVLRSITTELGYPNSPGPTLDGSPADDKPDRLETS